MKRARRSGPLRRFAQICTESPGTLTRGVTHIARWLGPDVLVSLARKDGQTIALVTYELSADRKTLTSRRSGLLEQVIVFDRR